MQFRILILVIGLFSCLYLIGCGDNGDAPDGKITYGVPRSDFTISLPETWAVEEDNQPTGDPFVISVKDENEAHQFSLTGYRFHQYQSKDEFMDRWFEVNQIINFEDVEFEHLSGRVGVSEQSDNGNISLIGILGTENQVTMIISNSHFSEQLETKSILNEILSDVGITEDTFRKAELEEKLLIDNSIFSIRRLRNYSFNQIGDRSFAEMSSMDALAPKLSISTYFFGKRDIPGGWDVFVGEEGAQKWLLSNRYDDDNDVHSIKVNGMNGFVEELELDEGQEAGYLMRAYLTCEDHGIVLTLFGQSILQEENEDAFYSALFSIECEKSIEN